MNCHNLPALTRRGFTSLTHHLDMENELSKDQPIQSVQALQDILWAAWRRQLSHHLWTVVYTLESMEI